MRTSAVAMGLLLFVLSMSTIPAEQLESVDSIEDVTVTWEGDATPTLVYEGVLSDPQDADNISLVDAPGMVHFIQLVHADEPLNIEVHEEGFTHGQAEANQTAFLSSSRGNPMWISIANSDFSSPNAYRILVHSNAADEDVALGNQTASGYIHELDNRGDRIYFLTGGSAEIQMQWSGNPETEFAGHMTHFPSELVTPFDVDMNDGNMTLITPPVDSRHAWYEISITAQTQSSTGTWSIDRSIVSHGDDGCHHDCPDLIHENSLQSGAHPIENTRWETRGWLSENDTVDVYPIFIPGEIWETHRVIANLADGANAKMQLQSWNNSGSYLTPLDVAHGEQTVGLNMTPGYHVLKVIRADDVSGSNAYDLDIQTVNMTPEGAEPFEGEMVDRWREFIPFYIAVGALLLAPLGYVLWSSRGTALDNEVQAHERGRLKRLRERIKRLIESNAEQFEIDSALQMLEEVQWRATIAEMGEANLSHHTDSITLKAWKISGRNLLVGIHVESNSWELAALRFVATEGPSWKLSKVSPASLFDGDEIFLDTLETGSTRFIQLELEGTAAGLDLQLSGLVDGKPLAAIPARALLMDDD
ncbi:MAG: hypothetical protein CMB01_05055 [Euryarchaeota archaeon]|nr:hypothetical protein [Euryarchaeota archaeon]